MGTLLDLEHKKMEAERHGNRNAQLEYPEYSFRVFAVTPQPDGTFSYTKHTEAVVTAGSNPKLRSLRMLVRSGGRGTFLFSFAWTVPGFSSSADDCALRQARARIFWTAISALAILPPLQTPTIQEERIA